ncbi:MAG TPA: ACP S-malonyltransferase [Kiloniellaceae bacterium]|nr:ACP S-malonyltransferase [Kiloniellaceae bacterium]
MKQAGMALMQTAITQPAMLTGGVAVWRVWHELGGQEPDYLAGHSLGEFTALVAAGSLQFDAAVKLVAARGRFMPEAVVDDGAMAAIIGLPDEQVDEICRQAAAEQGAYVAPANYNAPGQVVIAGYRQPLEAAAAAAKSAGARMVKMLPVSVPSHSELMQPASARLTPLLAETEFIRPRIPVMHSVDAATHPDPQDIRDLLSQQMHLPVRWTDTILTLSELGVTHFAECGPGKVLAGLIKRIARSGKTAIWQNTEELRSSVMDLA